MTEDPFFDQEDPVAPNDIDSSPNAEAPAAAEPNTVQANLFELDPIVAEPATTEPVEPVEAATAPEAAEAPEAAAAPEVVEDTTVEDTAVVSTATDKVDDSADDKVDDTADDEDDADAPFRFADLGLRPELLKTITALGYDEPTPIQREAIPHLLEGHDLLGQAATGTGKTAAFALPVLNRINKEDAPIPSVLVLVPTRELAVQVSEAMAEYGSDQRVKVLAVFGGQPIGRQLGALDRGVHVVVATPGRAIDHIRRGSLDLTSIKTVILDEADEMLDMGFTEDIETILESTPDDRQTVLFSATMPPRINSIAKRHQTKPVRVQIGKGETDASKALIRQAVYIVPRSHKASALGRILDIEAAKSAIVFCRTRNDVDQLTDTMNARGYRAEALHGGMDQNQRDRVMGRLREGVTELLIATDVAARGLDVDTLTHVVNYDVPTAPESFVHRIGRVGRAGREGVAITLAEPREKRLLRNIERLIKKSIPQVKVPTVEDLKARQLELTVQEVRESLASEDLDTYYSVLNALAGEDSDRNIALAAIKLVHQARSAVVDDSEIPDVSHKGNNNDRGGKYDKGGKSGGKFNKGGGGKFNKGGDRGGRDQGNGDTGFVYVGMGKRGGIRPGDLVGAIANEAGLSGREIGPIRISDHFSVVGVPSASVDHVIGAMNATLVKGKKAKVRRYVD